MDSSKTRNHNSSSTDTPIVTGSSPAKSPTQDSSFDNYIPPLSQEFSFPLLIQNPMSDISQMFMPQSLHEPGTNGISHRSMFMSSAIPQSNHTTEPLSVWGKPAENAPNNVDPDQSDLKKINDPGPERTKKRTSTNESGDGSISKQCQCKTTNCLSLDCDCFSDEVYCDESCSCQYCYNGLDFEDSVLMTKEQLNMNKSDEGSISKRCQCDTTHCLSLDCDCFSDGVYCDESCSCQYCYNGLDFEDSVLMTKEQLNLNR